MRAAEVSGGSGESARSAGSLEVGKVSSDIAAAKNGQVSSNSKNGKKQFYCSKKW